MSFDAVRGAIARACAEAGRPADSVTLVAASKTVPADVLEKALLDGHLVYGENRVQEARAKWPELRERHPGVELHLIGPLQSNKARDAVALFDVIQSVDRPSVAEALARQIAEQGRAPELFVQVNIGREPQKAGVEPDGVEAFLDLCRDTHGLAVSGLMCIPPAASRPSRSSTRSRPWPRGPAWPGCRWA